MKNLYLIPTDKPSKLRYNLSNVLVLTKEPYRDYSKQVNQNIYITSDEEIKEGDWVYDLEDDVIYKWTKKLDSQLLSDTFLLSCKKIIITTDQSLDSVQAIDDEFLEWFVENPSCEEVKVDLVPVNEFGSEITVNGYGFDKFRYKIIIPKEEPKEETLEEAAEKLYPIHIKSIIDKFDDGVTNVVGKEDINEDCRESFIEGAKWQAERMYSEEEVLELLHKRMRHTLGEDYREETTLKWFEQFKKK
jgi:hypothetical protein